MRLTYARFSLQLIWRTIWISFLLKILSVQKIVNRLGKSERRTALSNGEREWLSKWARRIATRLSSKPCLLHSTLLFSFDRNAHFCLGIEKKGPKLRSHAWI